MARSLKLERGWVTEVPRLTLLASDIIETIVSSRHLLHLDRQTLHLVGEAGDLAGHLWKQGLLEGLNR